jgi:hypothetical protein
MESLGLYQWLLLHLPFFEFLTLFAIAIGLFWHAVETRMSRKAAQKQLEEAHNRLEETYKQTRMALEQNEAARTQSRASQKPNLVLLVEQAGSSMGEGKLGLQRLLLKNIGMGPAFNIRVRSFEYQDYRIDFDPLDFIERENYRALGFVISTSGQYSGLAKSLILLESALLAEKNAVVSEVPIDVSYDDTLGNRYRTNAVIIVDHMSGKTDVKYPNICSPDTRE